MQEKRIAMLQLLGMKKKSGRKIRHIRKKLVLNLNIINLLVTFSLIQTIKGKLVKKRLRPGTTLRNFLGVTNICLIILKRNEAFDERVKCYLFGFFTIKANRGCLYLSKDSPVNCSENCYNSSQAILFFIRKILKNESVLMNRREKILCI